MNRLSALLVVCGIFLLAAATAQAVSAQASSSLSEEHSNRIRQNCVKSQTTLYQLHASDGLLRNNQGQQYELISTKLMAPLNSRIALNRLSGLKLTATSLEYDRQLSNFRSSYKTYEEGMSRVLKIDCVGQPEEFYNGVNETREKRQKLHGDVVTLNALLQTYKEDFEAFAKENGDTQ
jgi:hypothetical protein